MEQQIPSTNNSPDRELILTIDNRNDIFYICAVAAVFLLIMPLIIFLAGGQKIDIFELLFLHNPTIPAVIFLLLCGFISLFFNENTQFLIDMEKNEFVIRHTGRLFSQTKKQALKGLQELVIKKIVIARPSAITHNPINEYESFLFLSFENGSLVQILPYGPIDQNCEFYGSKLSMLLQAPLVELNIENKSIFVLHDPTQTLANNPTLKAYNQEEVQKPPIIHHSLWLVFIALSIVTITSLILIITFNLYRG